MPSQRWHHLEDYTFASHDRARVQDETVSSEASSADAAASDSEEVSTSLGIFLWKEVLVWAEQFGTKPRRGFADLESVPGLPGNQKALVFKQ